MLVINLFSILFAVIFAACLWLCSMHFIEDARGMEPLLTQRERAAMLAIGGISTIMFLLMVEGIWHWGHAILWTWGIVLVQIVVTYVLAESADRRSAIGVAKV